MSARRTRGGDLKDSKNEEREEAVTMASESDMMMMAECETDSDAADVALNAESSRDSKKRRVPTKEASIELLDSAKYRPEVSQEVETTVPCPIDEAVGKVGGGDAMQCGAAAGQASMSESTAHSEPSTDTDRASADGVGVLSSDESVGDAVLTVAVVAVATYKSVISSMARANESNPITTENYYLLHWLYRIRNASCLRGLKISFLRPGFLRSMYMPMMRSKKLWRTDDDIKVAADLWCFDRAAALKRYGHISDWDVSSVTDMSELFRGESEYMPMEDRFRGKDLFNDDISRWDVSSVTNTAGMFSLAESFDQPVGDWDVSNVTNMDGMFRYAVSFNQHVGDWDVSKVTNMSSMFWHAWSFNQPVGDWDVSKVTDMTTMFDDAQTFNQPVGDWDVSSVTHMTGMFSRADSFNQPVGNWDVSNVTDMSGMFDSAQSFNQPVGNWDVSSVTNMAGMFDNARSFNQPVGGWNVTKVTNINGMFSHACAFNQPVGDWDVSNVTEMYDVFHGAVVFDQDLTRWDMRSVRQISDMLAYAPAMQRNNKPAALRDDVDDDRYGDDSDDSDADNDDEGVWEEAEAGV